MTENIQIMPKDLSRFLIDRKPCAHADLFGTGSKSPLWGNISLYTTPLGVFVKADFRVLGESAKARALRLCLDGKNRAVSLPCTGGSCRCLTAAFTVEDVLGTRVSLCSEGCEIPLALGQIHSVVF